MNFTDVFARRGDERLYAEAKGRTTEIGLDVDTLYGQLLRRMADPDARQDGIEAARYITADQQTRPAAC